MYTLSALSWLLVSPSCLICELSSILLSSYLPLSLATKVCWLWCFEILFPVSVATVQFRLTFTSYLDCYCCNLLLGFLILVFSFKALPGWLSDLVSCPIRISQKGRSPLQTSWTGCSAMERSMHFPPLPLNMLLLSVYARCLDSTNLSFKIRLKRMVLWPN